MGVTNRDASNTTARRAQLALYAFRQSINAAPTAARSEQPRTSAFIGPTAVVPTEAYIGAQLVGQAGAGCACSSAVTLQGYDKKGPGC